MGCKYMDAVTYSNPTVSQFIKDNVIPLRVRHDQTLANTYNAKWTPTLVLTDSQGKEVYRNVGALPPDSLMPAVALGIGKLELQNGSYQKAIAHFEQLASKFPESEEAPEAIYFTGVSAFKMNGDIKSMKGAYAKLSSKYPNSSWTKKAQPYEALK